VVNKSAMLIRKAFKFKLKPSAEQRLKMAQTAGCVRLVWNKSLAAVKESLDKNVGYKGYCKMAGQMKWWKDDESTSFLKLVHSQPLQQTLKDLDRALRDGFKKEKGFPKFKKKGRDKAFRYPQGVKIDGDHVYLPKIGTVKFQESQEVKGVLKNTTVSFYCGNWYISFQTEFEQEISKRDGGGAGIDIGIASFATPRSIKKYGKKLAAAQRTLARRKKGANNWTKQKYIVQGIHKKIADIRRDFLHKASSNICKNHATIVIEDLKVSNMRLNKSILEGWYEFLRQLEYKSAWMGCDYAINADVNASVNILAAGRAVVACGDIRPVAV